MSLSRNSYPPLISRTKERLRKLKEKHEQKYKREGASEIVLNNEWQYYSQWFWSAIHIIVGISRFQTPEAIAKGLDLNIEIVKQTLAGLKQQNLVDFKQGRWTINPIHRHLDSNSPLNIFNHTNWRQKAISDAQLFQSESIHYTSVQSHNAKDFESIKTLLLKTIATSRSIVKSSVPDESLTGICVDFFKLT